MLLTNRQHGVLTDPSSFSIHPAQVRVLLALRLRTLAHPVVKVCGSGPVYAQTGQLRLIRRAYQKSYFAFCVGVLPALGRYNCHHLSGRNLGVFRCGKPQSPPHGKDLHSAVVFH